MTRNTSVAGQGGGRYSGVLAKVLLAIMVSASILPGSAGASPTAGLRASPQPAPSASSPSAAPAQEEGPDAVVPEEPVGDRVVGRGRYHVLTRNGDGTTTARFSPRPMHALDARTGEFHPFRNDLGPASTPGYSYESRGNGYAASWERPSDVANGRPVMRIAIGEKALTMTAIGARPAGAST